MFFQETNISRSSAEAELRAIATVTSQQRSYGFDGSWLILEFRVMHPHLFFAIVLPLFRLPMIQSSMN
jgi:hypothetical protein